MPMKNTGGGTREEAQVKIQAAREREAKRRGVVMSSPDELAAKLGLLSHAEWWQRRTGEDPRGFTTAMLLEALSALSEGQEIRIVAYSVAYARILHDRLSEWAEKVGVEGAAERMRPPTSFVFRHKNRNLDRGGNWRDFDDHYRPKVFLA